METFSALLAFCEGNSPVTGEFPSQRPLMRSFGVFLSAPEQTVEQTIDTPVIWDTIVLIMTSPLWELRDFLCCVGEEAIEKSWFVNWRHHAAHVASK